MTIIYQPKWNVRKWARYVTLALVVVLVWAGGAWFEADAPSPLVHTPASGQARVWGRSDAVLSSPVAVSPFAPGADTPGLPVSVTGTWVGKVQLSAGNSLPFSFNLQQTGDVLSGTARFPIGEARIEEGKIVGHQISFITRHRIQSSNAPLITTFIGEISHDVLEVTMAGEGVQSQLTLKPFPG